MIVEFDVFAGFVHISPENEKEQAQIYKFYVENSDYQKKIRMSCITQSEVESEDVDKYPTLSFGRNEDE